MNPKGRMTKVATCYNDQEPLVSTMLFPKYEFVCVKCGAKYTFFGPTVADETPKLLAKIKKNEQKWDKITDGYMSVSTFWIPKKCKECKDFPSGGHQAHATPEDWKAHKAAVKRMDSWSKRVAIQAGR